MKTIIQTIGPLYGDDANGTVFGQPNGSVYTPSANQLIVMQEDAAVNKIFNTAYVSTGPSVGVSERRAVFNVVCQVKWRAIFELATDSAFSSIVCSWTVNSAPISMEIFGHSGDYTVVNGTTYYGRVRIVEANGGGEIMKSDTYTFTGVV